MKINNIPSKCEGDCTYTWLEDNTPSVDSITPVSGSESRVTAVTITGTGLENTGGDTTVVVDIGGELCDIVSSSSTEIVCDIGPGPAGTYHVSVIIRELGEAEHTSGTLTFMYEFEVTAISPTSGGLEGTKTTVMTYFIPMVYI